MKIMLSIKHNTKSRFSHLSISEHLLTIFVYESYTSNYLVSTMSTKFILFLPFQRETVFRRQSLTSKDGPRTERIKRL